MDPPERAGSLDHLVHRDHPLRLANAMLRKVPAVLPDPTDFEERWGRKVRREKPVSSV